MNELWSKISSYNIFNYLFPGAVFSILGERFDVVDSPDAMVERLIWYYFIGMAISRVGSVVLEPILRGVSFVKYSEYSSYLRACSFDPKLELMVEISNTYRTLVAACALLLLGLFFDWVYLEFGIAAAWKDNVAVLLLCVLFLFSFKKQSEYVTKRVDRYGVLRVDQEEPK